MTGTQYAPQLEPTEPLRAPGTKREPTTVTSTELRKHARQIRGHTTATAVHMRRAIHATVLVLAKIVPFAPTGVRKHSVGFNNQLELFFIAALVRKSPPKTKTKLVTFILTRTGP